MLREVSSFRYEIHIDLEGNTGADEAEFTKCSNPSSSEFYLIFNTLDGATHVFNRDFIREFWFKERENK